MEAIRVYYPQWQLVLTFNSKEAQPFLHDQPSARHILENILLAAVEENPWLGPRGLSLNHTFVVSDIVFENEVHNLLKPTISMFLQHKELALPQNKIFAYEKWAEKVAAAVCEKIKFLLQALNFENNVAWDVGIVLTAPLRIPCEEYVVSSKRGDMVRTPCGTLAVIHRCEVVGFGHSKVVYLQPLCSPLRYLWFFLRLRHRVEDSDINKLEKVGEVHLGS